VNISPTEQKLLTTTLLLPLCYAAKPSKRRPVQLREVIGKIVWLITLEDSFNKDAELIGAGTSFNRKSGCQGAVCAIQTHLDRGTDILCIDGSNTYNECDREFYFAYLKQHFRLYEKHFAWINLFYAQEANALGFDDAGECTCSITVTTGGCQGCPSSLAMFQATTIGVFKKFPQQMISVSDDVNIVGGIDNPHVPAIIAALAERGLNYNGPKSLLLTHRNTAHVKKPDYLTTLEVTCDPSIQLGALVVPNNRRAGEQKVLAAVRPKMEKLRYKLEYIETMEASTQIKFMTLLRIHFHFLYYASTWAPHPTTRKLFREVDQMHISCLSRITGVEPQTLQVHFFHPIEDGGLGFLCYEELHTKLRTRNVALSHDLFKEVGLPQPIAQDSMVSVKNIWKRWSRTKALSEWQSVLQIWPTNKFTTFNDEQFSFHIRQICRSCPKLDLVCPRTNFDYSTSSGTDIWMHSHTCVVCAAPANHVRHERCNFAVTNTLKFYGYTVQANPKDIPIPGKRKGGPDFVMYAHENLAGDTAVTKNSLATRFQQKIRQYQRFKTASGMVIIPWIVSTSGHIYDGSVREMKRHVTTECLHNMINNSLCESAKGQHDGWLRIKIRGFLKTDSELEQWVETEDEDCEEEDESALGIG
jgi:hypothetical protein